MTHLILSTGDEEANGVANLGVVSVLGDPYSCAVFTARSVLPITNDLATLHI